MAIGYQVMFRPGRYRYAPHTGPSGQQVYMIGRVDDGQIMAWTFDEERAKHIVLALDLVNAYVTGDTVTERELITALSKMRGH